MGKGTDKTNTPMRRKFERLIARVSLHGTDHIEGKLINDHAAARERRNWEEKFERSAREKGSEDVPPHSP